MAATKGAPSQRRRLGSKKAERSRRFSGATAPRGRDKDADAATQEAWSAVREAVRSGKTQPATAARATGKALRNVARSGAKQTSAAAGSIARAAEQVLVTAITEARTAAEAARKAAAELERAVGKALQAIDTAFRKRARAAVKDATRKRRRVAVRKPPVAP
jgi:hypothetical protein